jgi:hypothetical protein
VDYCFIYLKTFVVKEASLQATKMQRLSTQQALEMILDGANPFDSDGEDINLQVDSDSELSQSSSGKISFHIISYFTFHFSEEVGKYSTM